MELLVPFVVVLVLGTPVAALYALLKVHDLSNEVQELKRELRRGAPGVRPTPPATPILDTPAGEPGTSAPPHLTTAAGHSTTPGGLGVRPATEPEAEDPEPQRDTEPEKVPALLITPDGYILEREPAAEQEPALEEKPAEKEPALEQKPAAEKDPFAKEKLWETKGPESAGLDFETLIGSTWLLRVGLGILAIALALFARSIAPQLSPGAKVAVAYAGSMAFFGLGKFFEDRLERFARPVMAAGLAFGFFVAFAAHFVPAMQAVSLTVSIAWMVVSMLSVLVAAERWQSETTAILAIVLGHVSAQVVAGDADIYSLVMIGFLALTAIVLLLRHEWVALGLIGVAISYGAHFVWLLAERAPIPGDQGFWLTLAFLTSYYVIFLIADVLWWRRRVEGDDDSTLRHARHARALGPTNLVLYVSLTTFAYLASGATLETIEWYFITLGSLQGALAWLYRDANHRDFVFYPAFGTILWTMGMFAAFDALVLNLVLAGQALLLLLAAHRTRLWVFHGLAQLALAVAFVQYLVGATPTDPSLPLFLGGLGIASVYLLKASLEEIWYGDGAPEEWFGTSGDGGEGLSAPGMWFSLLFTAVAPFLAALHAVLGGGILLRESSTYFLRDISGPPGDMRLALFLTVAHFGLLALILARSRPALLFSVATLAVGSVLLTVFLQPTPSFILLSGLSVTAIVLLQVGQARLDGASGHALWHAQRVAIVVLLGALIALPGIGANLTEYLLWMSLPFLLLAFQSLADSDVPRILAGGGEATQGQEPTGGKNRIGGYDVSTGMHLAIALLVIALTVQAVAVVYTAPVWIALWSALALAVAATRGSRGTFIAGYAMLIGGFAFFLFSGPLALSFIGAPDLARFTLASWWAGAVVTVVPLVLAIRMERRLDDARAPPVDPTWPEATLIIVLLPYAIGLILLGGYANLQLPIGWARFAPALVGLLLVSQADRLGMHRGVAAVVVGILLLHLQFLGAGMGSAFPSALFPLLLFAAATLALERTVQNWVSEERDHPLRDPAMTGLVVFATLTALSAIHASDLVGPTWATAGWSVLAGSMMAAGFVVRSATYRRVALALLGVCVIRAFMVDTVGLSDTARIGAFFVLGLILVGIALLYARYSEGLKRWI